MTIALVPATPRAVQSRLSACPGRVCLTSADGSHVPPIARCFIVPAKGAEGLVRPAGRLHGGSPPRRCGPMK